LRRCSFEKLNKKSGIQDFKKSSKSTSKSSWTPQVLHAPVEKQLYSHKRKRKERKNQSSLGRGEPQKKKTSSFQKAWKEQGSSLENIRIFRNHTIHGKGV